jgi:ABC-type Fe3+/spermidine/putrescine transport system ATPase subunit
VDLHLRGLLKLYSDFRLEVDLEVRSGELLALLGPSGCGKTTTLRTVAGFIAPDRGKILAGGRRIDGLPPHRRGIGIVFQDYALFPHLSVADNVAFGPRMHGWDGKRTAARVEELLARVSLSGYDRRKVTHLSGGEQQRVALARALAPNPGLLLLDEPLSALDAKLRQDLRVEIRRVQRELGITTVYVTHDQEEALALGDRIAVMREGRIEQVDTPRALYRRPANLFVASFLGQANLIPARVAGREGGRVLVDTPVGRFCTDMASGGEDGCGEAAGGSSGEAEPGAELTLFFRPESCELLPSEGGAPGADGVGGPNAPGASPARSAVAAGSGLNLFRVVVRRIEYLGSRQLLEVESAGLGLTLDLPGRDSFALGDELLCSVAPERCCLLAR